MSLQINILDKVEYYPVLVDNKYEARIYPSTLKVIWEAHLFSNIDAEKTASEIENIEEQILKQFNLINNG